MFSLKMDSKKKCGKMVTCCYTTVKILNVMLSCYNYDVMLQLYLLQGR